VCYVTDNELYPKTAPLFNPAYESKLDAFVRGAQAVITDCTYLDHEYPAKISWGHSTVAAVVDMAHRAGTDRLFLFHHDPDQTDDDIDAKLNAARNRLEEIGSETQVVAPREKDRFAI
jgi:ribonuclease BN (tRNA processing enzyme)